MLGDLESRFRHSTFVRDEAQSVLVKEVITYIKHPLQGIDFKVELRGTSFQKQVWLAVKQIPVGQTKTYSAIAREIGHERAVRAVGAACTVNPYAFVVPCHRVVHTDLSLSFGHKRGNDRMRPMVNREREALLNRRS